MKILIITGGESSERSISLKSAASVKQWVESLGHQVETLLYPCEHSTLIKRSKACDLVIPVIHGVGGEDGKVQKVLDSINIPYLFSGPEAHELAINKSLAKSLATQSGISVAKEFQVGDEIELPVIVKPKMEGSSNGLKLIRTEVELGSHIFQKDDLVEAFIEGREFTVGVIEYEGSTKIIPVIEIIKRSELFDYSSKYDPNLLAEEVCPADLEPTLASELSHAALTMHRALGAKHHTRTDFLLAKNNEVIFLETNTIPGLTETSFTPNFIHHIGLTMEQVFDDWIKETISRSQH